MCFKEVRSRCWWLLNFVMRFGLYSRFFWLLFLLEDHEFATTDHFQPKNKAIHYQHQLQLNAARFTINSITNMKSWIPLEVEDNKIQHVSLRYHLQTPLGNHKITHSNNGPPIGSRPWVKTQPPLPMTGRSPFAQKGGQRAKTTTWSELSFTSLCMSLFWHGQWIDIKTLIQCRLSKSYAP